MNEHGARGTCILGANLTLNWRCLVVVSSNQKLLAHPKCSVYFT